MNDNQNLETVWVCPCCEVALRQGSAFAASIAAEGWEIEHLAGMANIGRTKIGQIPPVLFDERQTCGICSMQTRTMAIAWVERIQWEVVEGSAWVCTDCLWAIEYGTEEARAQGADERWERNYRAGIELVQAAWLDHEVQEFSKSHCDLCRTHIAGFRHLAMIDWTIEGAK